MNADDGLRASGEAAESVDTSRRSLFAIAAATPLLILGLASRAGAQQAPACYNEASLPAAQKSMRRSLGFKSVSPDAAKKCGLCNFFSAPAGGCGKCALLTGGVVPEGGVCDSWAKKA
jgi:hypothetical protein